MVKRATWRKFKELKVGRFRIILYRERENASIFKLEIIDAFSNSYCGEVYAYFNDELVIMNNIGRIMRQIYHWLMPIYRKRNMRKLFFI